MPKIVGPTVPEHSAIVRRHVFEAFAELMAESSYDAITMAQLARRSGLGRTSIYHHFPDKEAVIIGFAAAETDRYLTELDLLLAESDDPVEQLRIYVDNHLHLGERFHMGLGPQLYGLLPDSSKRAIHEHVAAVEHTLRRILQAGVRSRQFTITDLGSTTALIHAALRSTTHLPPEAVEAFILRAVGAAPHADDPPQRPARRSRR